MHARRSAILFKDRCRPANDKSLYCFTHRDAGPRYRMVRINSSKAIPIVRLYSTYINLLAIDRE